MGGNSKRPTCASKVQLTNVLTSSLSEGVNLFWKAYVLDYVLSGVMEALGRCQAHDRTVGEKKHTGTFPTTSLSQQQ